MKNKIFMALLAFICVVAPVQAVETGNSNTKERAEIKNQVLQQKRTEVELKKEEALQNREQERLNKCAQMETKINFRLNQAEQNRDRHYTAFQNIRNHFDSFMERAAAQNCDISTLKSQLVVYDNLVNTFVASYRDWKTTMQATREIRCDENQAKVSNTIQSSQSKYTAVRTNSEAVRAYVQNTLKPTFVSAIQSCKPSPKPSANQEVKGDR